jgi:integrase
VPSILRVSGFLPLTDFRGLAAPAISDTRALVLLGTFASLRWAELAALRPSDIDLELCTIRVDRQLIEQLGGGSAFGPPKSVAGKRAVPFSGTVIYTGSSAKLGSSGKFAANGIPQPHSPTPGPSW